MTFFVQNYFSFNFRASKRIWVPISDHRRSASGVVCKYNDNANYDNRSTFSTEVGLISEQSYEIAVLDFMIVPS